MQDQRSRIWKRSEDGYYTRVRTVSDTAGKIARETGTSEEERDAYARQVNEDANAAFLDLLNTPKLKVG